MNKESKGLFSKWMIVLIVVMIIVFTAVAFFFTYIDKPIDSQLIISWYAFWGIELVNLCVVKVSKITHPEDAIRDADSFGDNQITKDILNGSIETEDSSNSEDGQMEG